MSAPNLKEIEWATHELESLESSDGRYTLLAALYTCRNEMLGLSVQHPQMATYSESAKPVKAVISAEPVARYGDSEFLKAVDGKDPAKVWAIMDDLMDSLRVVNRRVYDHFVQRLGNA